MFTGIVKGRTLSIVGVDYITSGSIGLEINFIFDDEWTGLTKTATFKAGKQSISMAITSNKCVIPHEVLSDPTKTLLIGVRGTDGSQLVIPTIWESFEIHSGATLGENTSTPESITLVEQLAAEIQLLHSNQNLPAPPEANGTYVLTATVSNGETVYSWVAQ